MAPLRMRDVRKALTPEQIAQLRDPDQRICGCGTFRDALKIATKNVAAHMRGDDCSRWFILVSTLEQILVQNSAMTKALSSHPELDETEIANTWAKSFDDMDKVYMAMVSVNEDLIAEAINGPIRAAYNGERDEG